MSEAFTSDFMKMCRLTIFNTFGFFFLDFLIPYVASVESNAGGIELGWLFSMRTVGYLTLAPIAGTLADRMSNKKLVLFGSVGRGVAYILLYLSIVDHLFVLMIIGNFTLGFMAGFYWIPLDNLISRKSHPNNRSQAFGIRGKYMGIGIMIGSFIGFGSMGFVNGFGIDNPYLLYSSLVVFAISNIMGGILFYLGVDENLVIEVERVESKDMSYLDFLRSLDRTFLFGFLLMLVVMFLSSTNNSIARPFIIVYLTQNIESDPVLTALAFAPSGLVAMMLAPKLGIIADRLNVKLTISAGAVLGAALTYWLISTSSLLMFSIILTLDVTVGMTTGLVIQNIISQISTENRGKVLGLQTVFADLGAIFGPVGGGVMWERYGYRTPFLFSIFVEIILVPFYLISYIRLRPFLTIQRDN